MYYEKPTFKGTGTTKIYINNDYDPLKRKTEINDYLESEILQIKEYKINCSSFSLNGKTKDYTEKGEEIILNFNDYLKINQKFKTTLKRLETYYKHQHEKIEKIQNKQNKKNDLFYKSFKNKIEIHKAKLIDTHNNLQQLRKEF